MGNPMSSTKGPSYYDMIQHGFEILKHSIIRPPRHMYNLDDLGPEAFNFGGLAVTRTDLALVNARGLAVVASHWEFAGDGEARESAALAVSQSACSAIDGSCRRPARRTPASASVTPMW